MEVIWKFHGDFTESLWNIRRLAYMENLRKTNRLGNYRLEKPKDAILWSGTRNRLKGLEMLRKIMDWAISDSGREVLAGIFWGAVAIIAVRVFCFLVCVVTGYPADISNIFG